MFDVEPASTKRDVSLGTTRRSNAMFHVERPGKLNAMFDADLLPVRGERFTCATSRRGAQRFHVEQHAAEPLRPAVPHDDSL